VGPGLSTEVLVLGCGIGGSVAALTLADAGVPVTVVTRAEGPTESNTWYAQGGIIYRGVGDSPDLLGEDILRAGAGLCHVPAVRIAATEGPALVERVLIDRVGVPFDRDASGALSLAREGSHSVSRVAHVADATGQAISAALVDALRAHPGISLLTAHTAVDLLTPAQHSPDRLSVYAPASCVGAYVLDQGRERVVDCQARYTVLATGGLGRIFLRTSNPEGARGDGFAMARRAGARVINMEFVQFHPTTFFHDGASRFLVSESVRGAGARLVTADGRPFMDRYAPEWKDLAPRDIVARAIHHEMRSQNLPNVYLDVRSYCPPIASGSDFPTSTGTAWPTASTSRATSCRWLPRRTTPAVGYGRTSGAGPASTGSTPSERSPAPASTGRTGWPAPRSSRGWSGATAPPRTSSVTGPSAGLRGPVTSAPGKTSVVSRRSRRSSARTWRRSSRSCGAMSASCGRPAASTAR
jgi:aspartate oxidase